MRQMQPPGSSPMDEDMMDGRPDVPEALAALEEAITLHRAHMDGVEPTAPESQERLQELLERAYAALGGRDADADARAEADMRAGYAAVRGGSNKGV